MQLAPESEVFAPVVYVDDILPVGADLQRIRTIKRQFTQQFEMEDLDESSLFLGITIERTIAGFRLTNAVIAPACW